jgi:hypothetical protein
MYVYMYICRGSVCYVQYWRRVHVLMSFYVLVNNTCIIHAHCIYNIYMYIYVILCIQRDNTVSGFIAVIAAAVLSGFAGRYIYIYMYIIYIYTFIYYYIGA